MGCQWKMSVKVKVQFSQTLTRIAVNFIGVVGTIMVSIADIEPGYPDAQVGTQEVVLSVLWHCHQVKHAMITGYCPT